MSLKVGIVGSGIGGIATAIRLACAGYRVEVFEANSYAGGKLSELKLGAYRFDAGPSLFTLPDLVDELFELARENPAEHFQYQKLDTICNYFYPDGTQFSAYADQKKLVQEIAHHTNEAPENIHKAIKNSKMLYDHLGKLFMYNSLNDPKTFLSKAAWKAYKNIYKFGFFKTMHQANKQQFIDPKITQFFNRFATYNGSSPYLTPATLNIIPHLEMSIGAYFPKGGMYEITKQLYLLALRKGVIFHFNSPVQKIILEGKTISGLQIGGHFHPFDRVVSNMDMVNTYKRLLVDIQPPKFLLSQPKSSSALIFYWGINRSFKELDLHNILFSADYEQEFDHIFNQKNIYHDPTIYINISSKHESADAPEGGENWFTMINVPNNNGQNWDQLIPEARTYMIKKINEMLKTDIEPLIEVEEYLDPRRIELKTSSSQGALYGNSSNNLFAAFLRHANKSKRVKGLYFCGGSVHPGGGIPLSLSSAKIVAQYFE